jgi:phage shock protein PspC (stress-responsive transcriptional regulator)
MDDYQQPDNQQPAAPESETPGAETPTGTKRLHRSIDQRMLLGVCGGLAEYFETDATLVRILFLLLALVGGGGVVLYAALAIIMPSEDKLDAHPREAARATVDEAVESVNQAVGQASAWVREKTGRSSSSSSGPGTE